MAAGHCLKSCVLLRLEISPVAVAQHQRPDGCHIVCDRETDCLVGVKKTLLGAASS